MRRLIFTIVGCLVLASVGSAAPPPAIQRLRGTVDSITATTLTLKTNDGRTLSVALPADTKFLGVTKSTLESVTDGVFIGTATKGVHPPIALEVLIFPEAMRGTGEGHYDWDEITDATEGGVKTVQSTMTNGTIKATSQTTVKSTMTNGTVKSGLTADGSKMLTVTFGDGKSIDITVPPTAPIVTVAVTDASVVKIGAKVFVVTAVDGDRFDAKRVFVGQDGLTPPM